MATRRQLAIAEGSLFDSTGLYSFSPDILPQVLTYDGTNKLLTTTVGPDAQGNSFRQTLTYTTGNVTGKSAWIKV